MKFPLKYRCLELSELKNGDYKLIPIRFSHRKLIMKWRNEQIYHLRQNNVLTTDAQNKYFKEVLNKLFYSDKPDSILFSLLKDNKLVGYGGLVHINWKDKNAEISFLINTKLENKYFKIFWINYLRLIEEVAFKHLKLKKIFTYAFDLRPHLYDVLEDAKFTKEAELKNHFYHNEKFKSVVIHSKFNK